MIAVNFCLFSCLLANIVISVVAFVVAELYILNSLFSLYYVGGFFSFTSDVGSLGEGSCCCCGTWIVLVAWLLLNSSLWQNALWPNFPNWILTSYCFWDHWQLLTFILAFKRSLRQMTIGVLITKGTSGLMHVSAFVINIHCLSKYSFCNCSNMSVIICCDSLFVSKFFFCVLRSKVLS